MTEDKQITAGAEIIVADDEQEFRQPFGQMLRNRGYRVTEIGTPDDLLEAVRNRRVDLVTLDLEWSTDSAAGIAILKKLLTVDPLLPVVMITGHATVKTAVEATRLGAFDYIEKITDRAKTLLIIRNAIESGRLKRGAEQSLDSRRHHYELIGASRGMAEIRTAIAQFGPGEVPVLIEGETGSGKELVAWQLHLNSHRRLHEMAVIGGAELSRQLGQDTLFGHRRGAYTGGAKDRGGFIDAADGSSLFLDDISDMAPEIQPLFLRFLESGDFMKLGSDARLTADVRIIAATNRHLPDLIKQGIFRADLYYRLKVATIRIPPLRERHEDIPPLVAHFARRQSRRLFGREVEFDSGAVDIFLGRDWPGNVRELKNAVTLALLKSPDTDIITADDIIRALSDETVSAPESSGSLKEMETAFRRDCLIRTLNACDGHISRAARKLGIDRSHLYRLINEYDLASYSKQIAD